MRATACVITSTSCAPSRSGSTRRRPRTAAASRPRAAANDSRTPSVMTASPHAYPDWKTPREDGEILIWPEPAELLAETVDNHHALSSADMLVQNVPLPDVRRRQRQWIHHDDAQSLIADGHQ